MTRFANLLERRFAPSKNETKAAIHALPPDEINEINEFNPDAGVLNSLISLISYQRNEEKPYLTEAGDLVIPFASPVKYHYWKEGRQALRQTLAELTEHEKAKQR